MMHFSLRTLVTGVLTVILVLATTPVFLAAAQTPAADHEAHHPGTPAAGAPASASGAPQAAAATTDPCAAITSTPPAGMPQAGMMTGTPPMGGGGMADMMGQFDLMFIDMMIPHHAGAVAMAQVALTRAEHPELRALAEQIIASQSAEITQMQTWRDAWFPDAPAMPMEEMMGMMGGMMGETGGDMGQMMGEMMGEMMPGGMMPGGMPGTPGAGPGPGGMGMGMMMNMGQEIADLCATTEGFDRAFIDAMIPHHQMAVIMATMATMRAEHPELRDLTQTMVEDQQREIEQMQAWRAAWAGAMPAAAASAEAVARQAIEAVNAALATGETSGIDAVFAPEVVSHPGHGALVAGEAVANDLAGLKAGLAYHRHFFPDSSITIDELITSGDTVAARVTFRGTPDATALGLAEEASRPLEIGGLMFGRIADGRVVEFWSYFDWSASADLIGMMPAAPLVTPAASS